MTARAAPPAHPEALALRQMTSTLRRATRCARWRMTASCWATCWTTACASRSAPSCSASWSAFARCPTARRSCRRRMTRRAGTGHRAQGARPRRAVRPASSCRSCARRASQGVRVCSLQPLCAAQLPAACVFFSCTPGQRPPPASLAACPGSLPPPAARVVLPSAQEGANHLAHRMTEELFSLPLEEALPILRAFGHYLRSGGWGGRRSWAGARRIARRGAGGRAGALLPVQGVRWWELVSCQASPATPTGAQHCAQGGGSPLLCVAQP